MIGLYRPIIGPKKCSKTYISLSLSAYTHAVYQDKKDEDQGVYVYAYIQMGLSVHVYIQTGVYTCYILLIRQQIIIKKKKRKEKRPPNYICMCVYR